MAVVEVAVKLEATTSPTTANFAYGDDVPIPKLFNINADPSTSSVARDDVAGPPIKT
jgi:hypothetical protein